MRTNSSRQILLTLFLGVLMGALDIAIVGPALPSIQTSFSLDERALAWIFTIYVLFNLISVPLMAYLSDTLGRRPVYILDVTLFALGSLIVAISSSFPALLVGRAIQGAGAGGIFPVASAVIGDTFPPEKRGGALGLIGAVFGVGFLVGPILAGVILLVASWHWLFIINLPIAAVVVWLSWRVLPSTRGKRHQTFDLPGMALLGVTLASLTYGINQIDTKDPSSLLSPNVLPFLLGTVILAIVLVFIESRASDPVIHLRLFESRQVRLAGLVAFGAGLGEASIVFVPALVVLAFGVSSSTASFMLLPAVLAMAVGSPLAGRGLDTVGSRIVVMFGTALAMAGMFVVGLLGTQIVYFYVAAGLAGVGLGILLGAPLRYILLNEAPASERASAQGLVVLFTSVGQLVGGALVGAIAHSLGGGVSGYTFAFLVVGAILLVLTALAAGLKNRASELETALKNHELSNA
jgi:EmrB/QacA subfamily drug resistance transporter